MLVMLATGSVFATPEFWVGIGFLAFLGLLYYYRAHEMVLKALDSRAEAIRAELDDARRLRAEAQQLLADYKRKRREAESEAKVIVEQAQREAEALTAETLRNLAESLERRTKLAEDKIARAETEALNEVRAAAVDAAIAAAEEILRRRVNSDVDAALVRQSISDLRNKLN